MPTAARRTRGLAAPARTPTLHCAAPSRAPLSSSAPRAPQAFFLKANADGVSLHSHLTELVHSLLQSKDPKALEKLESISLGVKAKHFTASEEGSKVRCAHAWLPPPRAPRAAARQTNARVHAQNAEAPAAPSDDGWKKCSNNLFRVNVADSAVPDVLEDMSFFEWAGVGLPRAESYKLMLALAELAQENPDPGSVRLFGKILGTRSDYFVLEATYAAGSAPELDASVPRVWDGKSGPVPDEAPGTGLNQCCYFVSNDVSAPFVQLPHVTPAQVVASQQVKKFLTGDLEADVACYPAFPGKEKNFLRAQLARISAATVLAPAGKFTFGEEVEEGPDRASLPVVDAGEEYEAKGPADMKDSENWVHKYGGILKIGRCANPPKPEPAEGEEEEARQRQGRPKREKPEVLVLTTVGHAERQYKCWAGSEEAMSAIVAKVEALSLDLQAAAAKKHAVALAAVAKRVDRTSHARPPSLVAVDMAGGAKPNLPLDGEPHSPVIKL